MIMNFAKSLMNILKNNINPSVLTSLNEKCESKNQTRLS